MLIRDAVAPGGVRAKVLDFGIAKLAAGQVTGTATHTVLGTPQYMSPEQCRGAGSVDEKTDVYSLSLLLYEMLAGRPPFLAEMALEYMGQHAFTKPPELQSLAPAVPPEVATLVHRMLAKDKAQRPSMREAFTALTDLMARHCGPHDETPSEVAATPWPLTFSRGQTLRHLVSRWPAGPKLRMAAAAAALLVTASATLLYVSSHGRAAVTPPISAPPPAPSAPVETSPPVAPPPPSAPPASVPEPVQKPVKKAQAPMTPTKTKTASAPPPHPRARQETSHASPRPPRPSLRELLEK